jgi:invasion protein IalB
MNGDARLIALAVVVSAAAAVLVSARCADAVDSIGWTQTAQTAPPARLAPRAPTATPPAATAAPAPVAQPAANGPPAQPTQAAGPIPTRTEILNFENWIVTCNEFAEGARTRVCSALLQIAQQNTNQIVFAWSIAVDNSKQMVTIMQTPTGVNIPPGVELRVGKVPPRKIPFASCDTGRCLATLPMDAALLREMAAVPSAEAIIQGSQGNTVQFNIQMKGFDKAYAVLSR